MTPSNARQAALDALCATAFQGRRLDDALIGPLADLQPARERSLARALAFGVCRYWHALTAVRDGLLQRPLRSRDRVLGVILLLGLHQLLQLRVPAHAAVNESVELTRSASMTWASGLVNAVLRRASREYPRFDLAALDDDTARLAHPAWLLDAWRTAWPSHWRMIAEAGNQQPPMVLRINPAHTTRGDYLARLHACSIAAGTPESSLASVLPHAIELAAPCDVSDLPGFADGHASVQDLAAQLAAPLLGARAGERVLDACAAPGGKTAHLLALEPDIAQLVAVDPSPARVEKLRDGLARLAIGPRVESVCEDARALSRHYPQAHFDRILIDAPCSGTGVIRRHPDIKIRRTPEQLTRATQLQSQLLDALWPLLARGGTVLYATCSVMPAENRDVVATFLARCRDAEPCAIALPVGRPLAAGHQILPGESGMDGFFYALLRKT